MNETAMSRFRDRDGNPVSYQRADELMGDLDYRVLAEDEVGEWKVVTVWLGLDQDCCNSEPHTPLLFGTAAVRRDGDQTLLRNDQELFAATEAEALVNHAELLDELRTGVSS